MSLNNKQIKYQNKEDKNKKKIKKDVENNLIGINNQDYKIFNNI